MPTLSSTPSYRGRLAPSPTGYLHLGHARTFWTAWKRAQEAGGSLIYRDDDLDRARCKPAYSAAAIEDLRWLGLSWDEGPDIGGPNAPYFQSQRIPFYFEALRKLHSAGFIFPCTRSRRDVLDAAGAPHEGDNDDEPVYPREFRPDPGKAIPSLENAGQVNWRFRVPDGERLRFVDKLCGPQEAEAGRDFGDFIVWRKDGIPSYQLACVVDDALMDITEVVRGQDLIRSTFRQLLLYRSFGWIVPGFCHCSLVKDDQGQRLAKRHDALSLRTLRRQGATPDSILSRF